VLDSKFRMARKTAVSNFSWVLQTLRICSGIPWLLFFSLYQNLIFHIQKLCGTIKPRRASIYPIKVIDSLSVSKLGMRGYIWLRLKTGTIPNKSLDNFKKMINSFANTNIIQSSNLMLKKRKGYCKNYEEIERYRFSKQSSRSKFVKSINLKLIKLLLLCFVQKKPQNKKATLNPHRHH
jgi:hypothetical protein